MGNTAHQDWQIASFRHRISKIIESTLIKELSHGQHRGRVIRLWCL